MRDRPAKRGFSRGAFRVGMNPLFVSGEFCELSDQSLINTDPVRHPDLGTDLSF